MEGRLEHTGAMRFLAGAAAIVALLAAALMLLVRPAGARVVPAEPLAVQTASLAQDGQDLVWQVELAGPFSPTGLRRDHRSLCVLLERASSGAETGQVCVSGPAPRGRSPRLIYMPVTRGSLGPGTVITATVTRSSNRTLSASFLPGSVGLGYGSLRWQVLSALAVRGCQPAAPGTTAAPGAVGCATLFPAKPALLRLHTPRLVGCVASGPDWVFHGPSSARQIALTFDDGPWSDPPSAEFVSELARLHVPATFFEIGRQIPEFDPHGTVERQMLADGDMIGDHTWSHPNMVGLSAAQQRQQLSLTAAAIRKATGGFEPCLFRAPYGSVNPGLLGVARSMGFSTIQWDVDPRDWALPGVNAIISNVEANAHNGAIVIQHFGGGPRFETLEALPHEIAYLRARGYQLVTVTQMLGYKLIYR